MSRTIPLKHTPVLANAAMRIATVAALAALAATPITGCGKVDNVQSDSLLEFANTFPEKPTAMAGVDYEPWTSSRAIATRGDELLVIDKDNGDLAVMDQGELAVTATIAMGNNPENVLVGPSGDAWITVRGTGEIVHLGADNTVLKRAFIGSEPFAMALRSDQSRLYVSLSEQDAVVALDPNSLEVKSWSATLDTPRALALSANRLHIVHQHDDAMSMQLTTQGDLPETGAMATASLRRGIPSDHMGGRSFSGIHSTRALAATVHPQSGGVLIAHVQAQPGTDDEFLQRVLNADEPEVQQSSGYGGSSASSSRTFNVPTRPVETSVSQIRPDGQPAQTFADHPVQDPKSGEPMTHLISQPSDINHHPTHTLALVTGYGSDRVLVLNTAKEDPMLSPLGLVEVGWAPKAVTFSADGSKAFVLNHQSLSVSEIDLTPFFNMPTEVKTVVTDDFGNDFGGPMRSFEVPQDSSDSASHVPSPAYVRSNNTARPLNLRAHRSASYGVDRRSPAVKRGQRVFTFSRNDNMSHAGQFACATCHFEGREDKLVWVIDDGPRQTPSLAGRLHDTGPFNWAGTKDQLQGNMVQTVARMGGQGLEEQEIADLEAFLLSMPEVPNPNVGIDGTLNAEQELGRQLFNRADVGCATCHSGTSFTDGRNYDVDTANEVEVRAWEAKRDRGEKVAEGPAVLNTPTLRGLFYTAPYLHDGSAETLMDVLELAPKMGNPELLSLEEKQALVAYLLTL